MSRQASIFPHQPVTLGQKLLGKRRGFVVEGPGRADSRAEQHFLDIGAGRPARPLLEIRRFVSVFGGEGRDRR